MIFDPCEWSAMYVQVVTTVSCTVKQINVQRPIALWLDSSLRDTMSPADGR